MAHVFPHQRKLLIVAVAAIAFSTQISAQQPRIAVDGIELDSKAMRTDLAKTFWQSLASTPCASVAWAPDFSSSQGFAKSVHPVRERFLSLSGQPNLQQASLVARTTVFSTGHYTIERVTISDRLLITSFAYLLLPRGRTVTSAPVVLLHGSGMHPQEAFGWTLENAYRQGERANHAEFIGSAIELAEAGYTVYVPWLDDDASTSTWPLLPWTALERTGASLKPRLSGFGPLYLLLNQILGGVDYLLTLPGIDPSKLAVIGWGEGAHVASAAAAADSRIAAVIRLTAPIDRPAWRATTEGTLQEASFTHTDCALGDFEMAALIAPRPLLYAYSTSDEKVAPLMPHVSLPIIGKLRALYAALGHPNNLQVRGATVWSHSNARQVRVWLDDVLSFAPSKVSDRPSIRQPQGPQNYRTLLIDSTEASRRAFTAGLGTCVPTSVKPDFTSVAAFERSVQPLRRMVQQRLGLPTPPSAPRVTVIRRTPLAKKTGYSIEFVQFRSNRSPILVTGLLTTPDHLPAGRSPAIVSADGNAGLGTPFGLLGREPRPYLNAYANALAATGTVVFVPYYPNEFPEIAAAEASARTGGVKSSFSYMVPFFSASADFLLSLPEVDPSHLGIWGISYAGNAALFTAALDTRFTAVVFSNPIVTAQVLFGSQTSAALAAWWPEICSSIDAVQTYLIAPRRLVRENGLRDANGYEQTPIESVNRIRDVYQRLGIDDQFDFVRHDGGHETRPNNIAVFSR